MSRFHIVQPAMTRILLPICGVAIGAYPAVLGGISLINDGSMEGMAPAVFGTLLALVCIAEAIKQARTIGHDRTDNAEPDKSPAEAAGAGDADDEGGVILPGIGLAALVVYVLAWSSIGYVVATLLLAAVMMRLSGWSYLKSTISAILVAIGSYLLFVTVLKVPVPTGPLLDILSLD